MDPNRGSSPVSATPDVVSEPRPRTDGNVRRGGVSIVK